MTRLMGPARAGISRRGILKGGAAIGAATLVTPWGTPLRAEPRRGGVLRIGIAHGNTSDNVDPAVAEHVFTQMVIQATNVYLTEILPDGSLVGEAAESWEASEDAVTWTFRLRDGIRFHDGRPLTAADVVASLDYHRGEGSTSAVKSLLEQVAELRADGDTTVVFVLSSGNADFPYVVSDYHMPIKPATDGAIDPLGTVGAGPFVFESFEPGVRATFTRNDDYFKEGRPYFDGLELLSIVDAAARQNALISGQVDVIDAVDLPTVHLLERAPGIRIISLNGGQHFGFPMDTRAAPFSDNNVRLALKYAIDRQELVDKILSGYGSVGNDMPVNPSMPFFDDTIEQREYDPERARFHLREAGMDSLSVDLHVANAAFDGAIDAGLLFAESAAAAGITINVVREPDDGYWSNVWMVKPFVGTYWGGRPVMDLMFTTAYAAGAEWNETFWDHPRFNELLVAARTELDQGLRQEMYSEMQRIVRDEGGIIIPMFANYTMAHSDRLAHPEQVGANWVLDGFRAPERWWFA
ncbi:ABC transporter substrate-binding protein [Rubellimicrobium sp. CFH 75288]|uniref:ABC transporter substrate-binding protein n=1 Tax=Rubellimicrobium sp. CFH 75288 TaxID=2697034 RepID=UPI001412F164|nr:ABC transporter substrate-binding protein [Rubellimicrobium sp. CFH 75288]NAZ36547.1 peptide ABC transporter substrate-binding protein [Rubellimicrobium sp. CFH 75288]